MGGEALYERYKDALKRGHVASLRGRLEEALTAYAEAATIAPERPTPHASAGTALLRRRRPADALRFYEAALRVAPRDETSLLGRAQCLAAVDRRHEAADAFDTLAEVRVAGGRLADAVDAARRGLELAEGRERRRTLERLIERLRRSEPGEPGRLAMERALRVLEGPAVVAAAAAAANAAAQAQQRAAVARIEATAIAEAATEAEPDAAAEPELAVPAAAPDGVVATTVEEPEAAADAGPEAAAEALAASDDEGAAPRPEAASEVLERAPDTGPGDDAERRPVPGSEPEPDREPEPEPTPASESEGDREPEPEPTPASESEGDREPEPEPEPPSDAIVGPEPEAATGPGPEAEPEVEVVLVRSALDRDLPADTSLDELNRLAEAALDGQRPDEALERLLDLAAANRRVGHVSAALDACYAALGLDPDHVGLHLALVQLYDEHGWTVLATEKLDLLDRLVGLGDDPEGAARVASARSGRG